MREKIIRYEPAGRGILSIKDAFYLTGSSSCLALASPLVLPTAATLPRHHPPSSLLSLRRPLSSAHTSRRHVAATYYLVLLKGARRKEDRLSLSFSPSPLLSRDRAHFPSFISREINQEDVSMASLYCAHRSFYTERVPHCRDATVQPRIEKARDSIERLSHDCPFLIHPL